jgi:EamA domain-containing membrane protein RarD
MVCVAGRMKTNDRLADPFKTPMSLIHLLVVASVASARELCLFFAGSKQISMSATAHEYVIEINAGL